MREESESSGTALLGGIALGAGLMYFLDPSEGGRRRAMARDRAVRALTRVGGEIVARVHHLGSRAAGIVTSVGSHVREEQPLDEVIVKRVRAVMGHSVSHPGVVAVTAHGGNVLLSGPIIAREVEGLLSRVRKVRGVKSVRSNLEAHDWAADVPGLQGAGERPERGVARLLRAGGGRRTVALRKTIFISAPVERVFDFFREFENYPAFMTRVRDVREVGGNRTHWVVDGPEGITVEWDADTTKFVPNEEIAWRSVRGSPIRQTGGVRFEAAPADATRVTLRMSYAPGAGARRATVASLFGADPAEEMGTDLMRVKTAIERGSGGRA